MESLAAMVARLLQAAVNSLAEASGESAAHVEICCMPWLECLNRALSDKGHIWQFLRSLDWGVNLIFDALLRSFSAPPSNGFETITKLVLLTLERAPLDIDLIYNLFRISSSLLEKWTLVARCEVERGSTTPPSCAAPQAVIAMFRSVNEKLQHMISKQTPSLTVDNLSNLISHISGLLRSALLCDPELARDMIPQGYEIKAQGSRDATTFLDDRATLIDQAWRMELYKKCIIHGRMDSRITGVESMQISLVEMWRKYIQFKPEGVPHHIVVNYLADFVLKSKLVHYLIGVESHPQIIHRSKNIVGFLVVTNKYTNEQTDLIWDSVLSSQDPRVVEAILEMLKGILELSTPELLVYLCHKINELPISCFDSKMTAYCQSVALALVHRWRSPLGQPVDLTPYWLMVRLIRQSAAEPSLSVARRRELRNFAQGELRNLLQCRAEERDKLVIFEESFNDVRAGKATAAASVSIMLAILQNRGEGDIVRLNQSYDITSMIVEDMSQLPKLESLMGVTFFEFPEPLHDRLCLVQRVIAHLPDTLTTSRMQQLWDSMVGPKALSDTARDMAWNYLAKSVQQTLRRNVFFDVCLQDLLPRLNAKYLTASVLEFANQLTEYDARVNHPAYVDTSPSEPIRAEIFRHIALRVSRPDIAGRSIGFFVCFNLEDPRTRGLNRAFGADRQKRLVDSCVEQLQDAAARLRRLLEGASGSSDDSMVIVPADDEVATVKLSFVRTFAILNEFMRGIRAQQPASPQVAQAAQAVPPAPTEGEIRVQYQPHVGGKSTGMWGLNIAETATVGDLAGRLRAATGFSEFSLIAGGSRINVETQKDKPLREMRSQLAGLLLVQKIPGSKAVQGNGAVPKLLPLESEIMGHFHEFYEFLSLEDDLGKDVYGFLAAFPPHDDIMAKVSADDKDWSELFPVDAPHKAMYSVYALNGVLSQALQEGASCQKLVYRGIQLLGNALIHIEVPSDGALSASEALVVLALAECLFRFLKEPSSEAADEAYFKDPAAVVERLQLLISAGMTGVHGDVDARIVCMCFASLLEACLHNAATWKVVAQDAATPPLLEKVWLHAPREDVRRSCVESLKSILASLSPSAVTGPPGFVTYFWHQVVALLPRAVENHGRAKQFFEVSVDVFRRLDAETRNDLPFRSYVLDWIELLLTVKHEDFRPQASIEAVIAGLSDLLNWCIRTWKAKKEPLDLPVDLMVEIFASHLFTPVTRRGFQASPKARLPVLDSKARGSLYSLVLAMSTEMPACRKLLSMTMNLLPDRETSTPWMHGLAVTQEHWNYDPSWNFDRWKAIRSATGYVGLKNLSNTCYMNSLLTQLFMNPKFRAFILSTHLTDPENSQKLLAETKVLFAYLQETWLRAVDPENVTDTVITYENSPIDISIQMDVDEFYNLLFDRWEGQIPSDQSKKEFRGFYGGQLVQQIKSRDCPHVSERMEPFSAIQCDIQGKTGLADSLSAYVEGEVMEGENKYACSSCNGAYVNAVKRACLKDIPDSLIFHLKRFDFDLMTGMRNKINEEFQFPREIDMNPYTVDYLKDPRESPDPDPFTLVGVLVHSGNAEAGHYYSYIRERPYDGDSWVEFNDADVTPFDPANLREQCFGGWHEQMYAGVHYPKTWSAYMLFYQRNTAMEAEQAQYLRSGKTGPIKVDIPSPLANRVCTENEQWIRRFCMFDPEHAKYSKYLLDSFRDCTKDICTDEHILERDVILFILQHLERIFCRQKDPTNLHPILAGLTRLVERCARCCRIFLDRLLTSEGTLRNFLLRCTDETMRKRTAAMVVATLKFLRSNEPQMYGLDVDSSDSDSPLETEFGFAGALFQCVDALKDLQHLVYFNWKAWDDYFGLLVSIASFGRLECGVLHEAGFLEWCLELLILDTNKHMAKYWHQGLSSYVKLSEKRRFSQRKLVVLVQLLLSHAKAEIRAPKTSAEQLEMARKGYHLTTAEQSLVMWPSQFTERHIDREDRGLHFLDRVLKVDNVDVAVCQDLVRITLRLLGSERPQARRVLAAIHQGCTIEPAVLAKPHLHAALAFCETCPDPQLLRLALERFANEVGSIAASGGAEHIDFFERARRLQNPALSAAKPTYFRLESLRLVPKWAPHLLNYPDAAVRQRTNRLLDALIFSHDTRRMDDERVATAIDTSGELLREACLEVLAQLVKAGKPIEASRAEDFTRVVRQCCVRFPENDLEDEDAEEEASEEAEAVIPEPSARATSQSPRLPATTITQSLRFTPLRDFKG